jgi:hypothetical protein
MKLREEKKFFLVSAKSGGRSIDMPYQASFLIRSLQNPNKSICDWKNDWKMITIFIGVSQMKNLLNNFEKSNKYFRQMIYVIFVIIQMKLIILQNDI